MTSPYDERIEAQLADYRGQVERLMESTRRMRELSATATAPRRTVTATVGSQGELTALGFPTDSYRELPPRELATIIVATVAEARREVGEQVSALVAECAPDGVDLDALRTGVGAVLPAEPRMPDVTAGGSTRV